MRRSVWSERRAASGAPIASGLAFHSSPGPLLVVAGLVGGAGTSTLAYLIAASAAAETGAPVLLADTGGPTATIARYSYTQSRWTLPDISERVAAGERVPGPFWADGPYGLRVLAGEPQYTVQGNPDAIRRILTDARAAHALSVIDAGTLARPADQAALSAATHIAWVLPASHGGVERGRHALSKISQLSRPEILIARHDPSGKRAQLPALSALSESRRAPLVLMGSLGGLTARPWREQAQHASVTLQAIGGLLQR
jgi:hypothetical protein